jgi:hypothetical protein
MLGLAGFTLGVVFVQSSSRASASSSVISGIISSYRFTSARKVLRHVIAWNTLMDCSFISLYIISSRL